MADGRQSQLWDHTAALMWIQASINRDPKKPAPKLHNFHPYYMQSEPKGITQAKFDAAFNMIGAIQNGGNVGGNPSG